MRRILVLRSGGSDLPPEASGPDVALLTTHEVLPVPAGIAETLAFDARGARLVVSSKVTVEMLDPLFFEREFIEVLAVGEESARELRRAGARDVVVPGSPGAAGVLHLLRESPGGLSGLRILWPRGSDADAGPLEELSSLGALVTAPVVYEKRLRPAWSLSSSERELLSAFRGGGFGAVAVGSVAALEVFLSWLGDPAPEALPPVRWGVLGPETARAVSVRGIGAPAVPGRARFADLIDLLRKEPARTP
ncbi:MAG TPA: uroporphyrinogen-III synthase [Thermoanaerobaculia bacterium]|nr:uroporphyrinogen-III synthase [Thermoanaerobaculia bacterium]